MWHWQWPITDLRKAINEARAKGETTTALHKLENVLAEIETTYQQLEQDDQAKLKGEVDTLAADMAKAADARAVEKVIETQIKVVTAAYAQAVAYTNVVIVAGYAAFFGLWSLTKQYLDHDLALWAALLMLASIVTFVSFELYKMIVIGAHVLEEQLCVSERIKGKPIQEVLKELDRVSQLANTKLATFRRVWKWVLLFAIGPALFAAAILALAFVRALWTGELPQLLLGLTAQPMPIGHFLKAG